MNEQILREIGDFCRRQGLAESTFGRRAVNDGKLASRLRNGGSITTDTLDRIRAFMAETAGETPAQRPVLFDPPLPPPPPSPPARRATTRSAISASSTTGKNTCCS